MYLLYVDDSGKSHPLKKKTKDTSIFGLGAYLVHVNDMPGTEITLKTAKKRCYKDTFEELKFSKDIEAFKCFKNPDIKCKKSKDAAISIKDCHRNEIYPLISEIKGDFFYTYLDKKDFTGKPENVERYFYKRLFEDLLKLVFNHLRRLKINEPIVIFVDNKNKVNHIIQDVYNEIIAGNALTSFKKYNIFPSTINICNSKYTVGIQVADLVAGALTHSYEKNKKEHAKSIAHKFPNDNGKYLNISILKITN